MAELKAIELGEAYKVFDDDKEFYLKYEADNVIAEKDKEIQRLENLCESYRIDCDNLAIREASDFYFRWHKHWLELTEKLKEAK